MEMQLDNVTGNHRIAVTIREFSRMVGLSEASIRGYLMRDPSKLPPTFRVGIRILFRIDDIERWLKNSPAETPRSTRGPGMSDFTILTHQFHDVDPSFSSLSLHS